MEPDRRTTQQTADLAQANEELKKEIAELRQALEELRRKQFELRRTTDAIPCLITVLNPDGVVLSANQALLEYTGLTLEDVQKEDYRSRVFHPEDLERQCEQRREALTHAVPFELEHRALGRDGKYRWFFVRYKPLLDEQGKIVRWYVVGTDIDERKQAEEKLRRNEWSLLEAQRLGHTGSWSLDIASGIVTSSPEMFRAYDVKPGEDTSSPDFWFNRIHPEDRKPVRDLFERCLVEKTDYEACYRLLLPDGTIKYQHSRGCPVLGEAGELLEFSCSAIDTTEHMQARIALEKAFAEIQTLKDQLYKENLALRDEVDTVSMFGEIVGTSPALQTVLSRVIKVAPTDTTVLITGETGTGKELIARAIHKGSPRSQRAFVSVNCAALTPSLISSELFGYEKGAFTGATQRRMGRFELADGGTIFLDEIGELPSDTQVALLRVLQEREFDRVGGTQSVQVDVRVIAATNRNLDAAIANGAFRTDLFYRLNVFPIDAPPLRKRKDDVLMLLEYFVNRYATKIGKRFGTIDKQTLELFLSYDWPGNIRELQNVVERSVIVSSGDVFRVDEAWLSRSAGQAPSREREPQSADEHLKQERQIIEAALRECRGRIYGPNGAAAKLRIPPTTLDSRIKRLKISKTRFKLG